MSNDRLAILEERITHLMRANEELSDEVARQGREIDRLTRSLKLMIEREAERDMAAQGGATADQRPPHY